MHLTRAGRKLCPRAAAQPRLPSQRAAVPPLLSSRACRACRPKSRQRGPHNDKRCSGVARAGGSARAMVKPMCVSERGGCERQREGAASAISTQRSLATGLMARVVAVRGGTDGGRTGVLVEGYSGHSLLGLREIPDLPAVVAPFPHGLTNTQQLRFAPGTFPVPVVGFPVLGAQGLCSGTGPPMPASPRRAVAGEFTALCADTTWLQAPSRWCALGRCLCPGSREQSCRECGSWSCDRREFNPREAAACPLCLPGGSRLPPAQPQPCHRCAGISHCGHRTRFPGCY